MCFIIHIIFWSLNLRGIVQIQDSFFRQVSDVYYSSKQTRDIMKLIMRDEQMTCQKCGKGGSVHTLPSAGGRVWWRSPFNGKLTHIYCGEVMNPAETKWETLRRNPETLNCRHSWTQHYSFHSFVHSSCEVLLMWSDSVLTLNMICIDSELTLRWATGSVIRCHGDVILLWHHRHKHLQIRRTDASPLGETSDGHVRHFISSNHPSGVWRIQSLLESKHVSHKWSCMASGSEQWTRETQTNSDLPENSQLTGSWVSVQNQIITDLRSCSRHYKQQYQNLTYSFTFLLH